MASVQIFTDGACSGNPGPGGFGVIIRCTDDGGGILSYEYSRGYEHTTNNRMELMAVICGLDHLSKPSRVEVVTDSSYVCKAITDGWIKNWVKNGWKTSDKKPVKNKDLWLKYLDVSKDHNVKFTWVRGHNGHPENERCDRLAVTASMGTDLLEDIMEAS